MPYGQFIRDNLAKPVKPDFKQITQQLKRAEKDLKTADAIAGDDLTWAYTIAYHAMLRAGRALMFSHGVLPTTRNTHKTIVEFTKVVLGSKFENLVARFGRMRRERHDFIYDSQNGFTARDVDSAITIARKLICEIVAEVKKLNPQRYML